MYLANKLHKELDEHFSADEFLYKRVKYSKISESLNKILKPLDARVRVIRDKKMKVPYGSKHQLYTISGYFDTLKKKNAIMINIHLNPSKKEFKFTKSAYNGFKFMFAQVVQHEFIHKTQYTYRPAQSDRQVKVHYSHQLSKERLKEIDYLSSWCEIEAYAHDIAMEIKQYHGDKNPAMVIKQIDKYRNLYSYNSYKQAFKGTDWSRLKKSLLRKVWRWMDSARAVPII